MKLLLKIFYVKNYNIKFMLHHPVFIDNYMSYCNNLMNTSDVKIIFPNLYKKFLKSCPEIIQRNLKTITQERINQINEKFWETYYEEKLIAKLNNQQPRLIISGRDGEY